jgi:NAD(P)-dependent dehydrogenase (short-subunit alcohol dehydrogenase family)
MLKDSSVVQGGVVSNAGYEPQQVPADDTQEREFMEHINVSYEEVMACIHEAEFILILGPGEAKGELKERIEKQKLPGRIVGVETVHKMTDRQIVAKVRKHFQEMELCQLAGLSAKCS